MLGVTWPVFKNCFDIFVHEGSGKSFDTLKRPSIGAIDQHCTMKIVESATVIGHIGPMVTRYAENKFQLPIVEMSLE